MPPSPDYKEAFKKWTEYSSRGFDLVGASWKESFTTSSVALAMQNALYEIEELKKKAGIVGTSETPVEGNDGFKVAPLRDIELEALNDRIRQLNQELETYRKLVVTLSEKIPNPPKV